MTDFIVQSTFFGAFLSLAFFRLGMALKAKFKHRLLNPLLITIICTIAVLAIFKIPYETYNNGAKYLGYLLTPATISLAVPLYEQFNLLKENKLAIIVGVMAGVVSTMLLVLAFAIIFNLDHTEFVTFLPKSVTTAIGIGISEELGGYVPITVASIVITGNLGDILAEPICRIFKITHPIAKGIGIGSASHAIGTAKAMEIGEVEGAMSGLALVVSGVLTVPVAAIFSYLYL